MLARIFSKSNFLLCSRNKVFVKTNITGSFSIICPYCKSGMGGELTVEELLNSFGQTIKDARIAAGMTQDALAEQTGVTPRYIMAIENENKHPRMPVLLKIIRTLKISADTIFYPEIQHTDREKEQLLHMIQLCGEKEIKIAAATVKALLDAR